MALSQKHQGKMLVPWFHSDEWILVYNLIYSQNSNTEDKNKALKVLQRWKKRMPKLFIGVEGTLIILEALLEESVAENVKRSFCATAIMRFLNICAANTETQGTFYYTAKKNKFPDWLVDMRHSSAHSHDIPLTQTLNFALKYCLQWLKSEYWDVQKPELRDFMIMASKSDMELTNIVDVYCELVVSSSTSVKQGIELRKKLQDLHFKVSEHVPIKEIQRSLLALLSEKKFTGQKIVNAIVDNASILKIPPDLFKTTDTLPNEFVRLWENLMQYLQQNKILILLIKSLNQKINNDCINEKVKKISSMWLNEIFKGLVREKMLFENTPLDDDDLADQEDCSLQNLNFFINDLDLYKDLVKLKDDIVEAPNVFTSVFLGSLLKICGSDKAVNAKLQLAVRNYTMVNEGKLPSETGKLYTLEDLREILESDITEPLEQDVPQVTAPEVSEANVDVKRWQIVTNTSIFEGCPLGTLPYPIQNTNPLFTL